MSTYFWNTGTCQGHFISTNSRFFSFCVLKLKNQIVFLYNIRLIPHFAHCTNKNKYSKESVSSQNRTTLENCRKFKQPSKLSKSSLNYPYEWLVVKNNVFWWINGKNWRLEFYEKFLLTSRFRRISSNFHPVISRPILRIWMWRPGLIFSQRFTWQRTDGSRRHRTC